MLGHCVSKHRELSPQVQFFAIFTDEGHSAETNPANLKYFLRWHTFFRKTETTSFFSHNTTSSPNFPKNKWQKDEKM